jgi:hypothetical protein
MKKEYEGKKFVSGGLDINNLPVEMILYQDKISSTSFVRLDGDKVETFQDFFVDPRESTFAPYPASNSIIKNNLVLFPSIASEYESEEKLLEEIRVFVHHYLDLSPFFERIVPYYVLFTWVYDKFNELPYLRAIGDYGSGKSRFLKVIGSLCYKPIFANGATTVSPIFRLIDEFKGTLILDEADFNVSDYSSEMIKILNSGHSKGMPVIRSEGKEDKNYEPRAFNVYCPKIIATRGFYRDKALESRFIVEEMGYRKLRSDIPINIPSSFDSEALVIRNKLLMFRLKNYDKIVIKNELVDPTLEPRLNQIIVPLMSIISDPKLREDLGKSVREYHQQMVRDRGMEMDGQILEVIKELIDSGVEEPLIGQIRENLSEKYGEDYEKKITAKGVGSKIRQSFKLKTEKTRDGYKIPQSETEKLDFYFERFGIVNDVNVVNIQDRDEEREKDVLGREIDDVFGTAESSQSTQSSPPTL